MKPKKKNGFFYLYLTVVFILLSGFLSLHVGYLMAQPIEDGAEEMSMAVALQQAATQVFTNPTCVFPVQPEYFKYTLPFVGISAFVLLYLFLDEKRNEHANEKIAQGSAKWNTDYAKYNKKYTDPPKSKKADGPLNMILSENVKLSMNTRQTFRNNCILAVGGSGAGKSRYLIKPNLLQANCSYVITDPAGELLQTCGTFLEKQGYKIKVFNLVEKEKSDCYNPFEYIRDETGIMVLVNCLIQNTNNGKSGGDPFWEKSETALLIALIAYLKYHRPKKDQNFANVMKLLRIATVDEDNPKAQSKLDEIFEQIGKSNPNDIAYKNYMTFKQGAGKTLKSILISCSVRLNSFNLPAIENLTNSDTLALGELGDKKQALFVIIPAADSTFNYLVSMMYSQLFETLYFHAETECPFGYYIYDKHGNKDIFIQDEVVANQYLTEHPGYTKEQGRNRVFHHVRFMLDEFANIGQIPEFEKKLATMRKYELSCTIVLQNLAQLKTLYKDSNEDIIGNCDSFLFLGNKSYDTLEYVSKMLGSTTIKIRNHSRSQGGKGGSNLSFNLTKRELLNPNEVSLLEEDKCLVLIRGLDPFLDEKYNYENHPNYKFTGDADHSLLYINKKDNTKIKTAEDMRKDIETEKKNATKDEIIGETVTPIEFSEKNGNMKSLDAEKKEDDDEGIKLNTMKNIRNRNKKQQNILNTIQKTQRNNRKFENVGSKNFFEQQQKLKEQKANVSSSDIDNLLNQAESVIEEEDKKDIAEKINNLHEQAIKEDEMRQNGVVEEVIPEPVSTNDFDKIADSNKVIYEEQATVKRRGNKKITVVDDEKDNFVTPETDALNSALSFNTSNFDDNIF